MKLSRRAWLLLLIPVMALWGMQSILVKAIGSNMGPFTTSALRFLAGWIVLALAMRGKNLWPKLQSRRDLAGLLALSFFQVFVTAFVVIGYRYVDGAVGSILLNINPFFIAIFAPLLIAEKKPRNIWISLILVSIGMYFAVTRGMPFSSLVHGDVRYVHGVLLMILTALMINFIVIGIKYYFEKYSPFEITTFNMLLTLVFSAFLAGIFGEFGEFSEISTRSFVYVFFNGIDTAVVYLISAYAMREIGVITTNLYKLLIPIFSTLHALWFLKEPFSIYIFIGLGFATLGIYLIQKPLKKVPPVSPEIV